MIPLINETYKAMLTGKSVIRELNEYANDIKQHPHLKMEGTTSEIRANDCSNNRTTPR